jgi:serine/threonine protein kinase
MNKLYCFDKTFTIIKRLSEFEGSYGEIYVIEKDREKKRYLAKIAKNTPDASASLRNEYKILEYLGEDSGSPSPSPSPSPYIIKTYCYEENKDYCILILEYAEQGDLHTIIYRKKLLEKNALKIFRQILKGVKYCHSKGVFHRDLKTENIVIGERHSSSDKHSYICKIIDFGMAKIGEPCVGIKGTDGFIPYEVYQLENMKRRNQLLGENNFNDEYEYDCAKADIYALGMIFVLLITKREFFDIKKLSEQHEEYAKNPDKYWSKNAKLEKYREVVDGMINVDPKKRWSIDQIQKWFTPLDI